MKLFKISGYSIFVTTLLLVMSFFRIDVAAQDNYLTAREAPKVLNGTKVLNLEPSSLTGYCSSSGGSTKFESIQAVDVSPNPDGSTLTITVSVYIANPNGCESGKSCSSYDANPESVNVWIDWNGNGTFDSSEQVINVNATGYLNINYSGTMTVVQQVTIPSSYADKLYLRANLGWGSDPGPCDSSWSWGNVVDQEITLPALQVPKITDLKIYPKFPRTMSNVQYEPVIKEQPGYTLKDVSYITDHLGEGAGTLDFGVSEDNTLGFVYSFYPDAGNHGRTSVSAVLTLSLIHI